MDSGLLLSARESEVAGQFAASPVQRQSVTERFKQKL